MNPIHRYDRYRHVPGIEVSASFTYRGKGVWELYLSAGRVMSRHTGTRREIVNVLRYAVGRNLDPTLPVVTVDRWADAAWRDDSATHLARAFEAAALASDSRPADLQAAPRGWQYAND